MPILAALVLVSAAILALPAAESAAPPRDLDLTIAAALPGGKDLRLLLRHDGTTFTGVASASTYNRLAYEVDASQLTLVGTAPQGAVSVTIPSDGWVPPAGTRLAGAYTLTTTIADGTVTGTYAGTTGEAAVTGAITGRTAVSIAGPARMVLNLENAIHHATAKPGSGRRLRLTAGLAADGTVHSLKAIPPGSITDTSCCVEVLASSLAVTAGRCTGTYSLAVTDNDQEVVRYDYDVDLPLIADTLLGHLTVTTASGKEPVAVIGHLDPATAEPATALHTLRLIGLPESGHYLVCYLAANDGVITHGFAATPNYNNATHPVEVTGLRLVDGAVTGRLVVSIVPDPWIPKDRRTVAAALDLAVVRRDREQTGTYTGTVDDRAIAGPVDGWLDPAPAGRVPAKLTLKLENALVGGTEYHNRAFVSVTFTDGRVSGGKVSNNHTRLSGTVTGGDLRIEDGRLVGTVAATIAEGGGVTPGAYTFAIDAPLVGEIGAGAFTTTAPDGTTKAGRLWGSCTWLPTTNTGTGQP